MSAETFTALKRIVGAGAFIDTPSDMAPYLRSMRNRHSHPSSLVLFPSTTGDVVAIVKLCNAARLPLVPQGGNTGLVDGGIPSPGGNEIILNLSRMNKIREMDGAGLIVTVEAGVILQTLQAAAQKAGYLFPLSMGSQGSMQIGGAISTNAGGTAVVRYGNTRQLTLGLEVVLADGSIFSSLRKLIKDNAGYNLSQYFIGAEGTLGIITAATLRLFPAPRQTLTAMIALTHIEQVIELFVAVRRECAEVLSTFEIISHAALKLVLSHKGETRFPCSETGAWYVLLELSSSSADMPLARFFENVVVVALDEGKALDASLCKNLSESTHFWELREQIPEALRQHMYRLHFDISLPLERIADFVTRVGSKIKLLAPDMVLMPFGHVGDGNLHYNMYLPQTTERDDFEDLKKRVQKLVFDEVNERQGSLSAEHGIGLERKEALVRFKKPVDLTVMRSVKRALDPLNIMNPGKVFDMG